MKKDVIIKVKGKKEIERYLGRGAVVDEEAVESKEVVEVAKNRARRAFLRRENVSSSLETETLLYVAGVRQINKAIEIAGVKESTESAYVALFSSEIEVEKNKKDEKNKEDETRKGFERISLLEVFK